MSEKLLPCPFCGNVPIELFKEKGEAWGSYKWILRCSSSHCAARVEIIADGWVEQLDGKLNPHIPKYKLYRDRLTDLRQMWNTRAVDGEKEKMRKALEEISRLSFTEEQAKEEELYHGGLSKLDRAYLVAARIAREALSNAEKTC